jgi:O-antigen ligase
MNDPLPKTDSPQADVARGLATGNDDGSPASPQRASDSGARDLGGLIARDEAHDPIGRRILLATASLWCFLVAWPVTFVEFAGIPLLLWSGWRLRRGRAYIPGLCREPLLIAACAFGAAQFASFFWTGDRAQWLEQAGQLRWIWAMIVLWPLADRRATLWSALAAGFLLGNLTQLSQIAHVEFGWATPTWDRAPDRYSGWWKPVVGGSVLVAVFGGHLSILAASLARRTHAHAVTAASIAVRRDRRHIALAVVGAVAALAGIVATGTRGAWVAAAGLTSIWLVALAWIIVANARGSSRQDRRSAAPSNGTTRASRRWIPAGAFIGVGVMIVAIAWFAWTNLGDSVARRVALARAEIAAAVEKQDYASDTGARIGMAIWSGQLFREHPFIGVGAGGFRPAVHGMLAAQGTPAESVSVHDHAHNGLLHIAATTGLLGLLPALTLIALSLRGSIRAWRASAAFDLPGVDRTYTSIALAAPLGALLGLLLVSAFDPVHLNAQSAALLATILALAMPGDRAASEPRSPGAP